MDVFLQLDLLLRKKPSVFWRCKLLAEKFKLHDILYPFDYKTEEKVLFKFNLYIAKKISLFHYGIREISTLLFYQFSDKL